MGERQWEFSDGKGATHRFAAIDGYAAWRLLGEITSLELPHSWNINCVCPCGTASPYTFCSRACFEKGGAK